MPCPYQVIYLKKRAIGHLYLLRVFEPTALTRKPLREGLY